MAFKLDFDGITLYLEKRYDPITGNDMIILMDEPELRKQEAEIKAYMRMIK